MIERQNKTVRVIKVGGSLLTWPKLRDQLPAWLETLPAGINLLIFGGGECVEAMRELDALWSLDPTAMHWRCVRLLNATFEIAQELWPAWSAFQLADNPIDSLQTQIANYRSTSHPIVVQPSAVYTGSVDTLPHHWATTTDSIAAYLANALPASELYLLKSTSPQLGLTLSEAAALGFVDDAFPSVASSLYHIRSVDLTDPTWPTTEFQAIAQ